MDPFFQQVERIIIDLQRQHGVANERYTEYVIEKLALVHSSVQEIHDVIEEALNRSPSDETFCHIAEMLRQLKEVIVSLEYIWQEYQSSIEERSTTQYSIAVEYTQQRGRPRFAITREQLEYLHSLSFTWDTIVSILGVS